LRTAIIVPCYKRPEYTKLCLEYLEKAQVYRNVEFFMFDDGSEDGTEDILATAKLPGTVTTHPQSLGLRSTIIEFFEKVRGGGFTYLAKMDNDCLVPEKWLDKLIDAIEKTGFDIVSPNVMPSNAAFKLGGEGEIVRPSDHVGGLWCMKARIISGIQFERYSPNGISGAFNLLKQIIAETDAKVGWVPSVEVQDIASSYQEF
jgi:glycosyltransferase involved in cell wall biosynthesis